MLGREDQGFVDINTMALNAAISGLILADPEACFVTSFAFDVAAKRMDAIVRESMAKHYLKAVLADVAIDRRPRGESVTGVPVPSGQ
jgi:hypothetical protein